MEFQYHDPFPLGEDTATYTSLGKDYLEPIAFKGDVVLKVGHEAISLLTRKAFTDVNFLMRTSHQELVARILEDPEASDNDRYIARAMLLNAVISAERNLPFCQDTGTAIIYAKKGHRVATSGRDEEAVSLGVFRAYTQENFRYSQMLPLSMYEEKNSGTNLPAQIDIMACHGTDYRFLFVAKGGGSANKSQLFQMTKAVLTPAALKPFLVEKMKTLGTAACPPYHLVFVVGGTSAEAVMKVVKLASCGWHDGLPTQAGPGGQAFRDLELEQELLEESRRLGIGAQFGGKYFCHDVRVVRLPRHGASCPIGMGVSCSADRNIKGRIDADGIWLEQLDLDPMRFLKDSEQDFATGVPIDLNRPMEEIRGELSRHPVKTLLRLTGKLVVARDMAHAALHARLQKGEPLPEYMCRHPVYYAGPAKRPNGMATGSFGPTTAQRMDSYVDSFQKAGGSHIMIAKGNRSQAVTEACQANGGFYLGSPGGPAALLAKNHILSQKIIDYPEFGMEAIWEIEVKDFPAIILVDDKGNDFFRQLL
ncbi:MAG: FumA C-terminus/TtdB family hydratase beta subunit [bacterium]|jgi:fumarate hydratase class I|nr:FumA C-terminus/TtdB family hydratase beta subunit [bacterium]